MMRPAPPRLLSLSIACALGAAGAARADVITPSLPPVPYACTVTAECPTASVCSARVCVPTERATAADEQAAKDHETKASAAFAGNDYAGALAEYQQAYKLAHAPALLKQIALCQKGLQQYADARDSLRRYVAESRTFPAGDPAQAQQLIAELSAQVTDLMLDVQPGGAAVTIDGKASGTSPFGKPLTLAPGKHVVEVTAAGYTAQKQELTATGGTALSVKFALSPAPTTAKVRFSSLVPSAMLTVDGKLLGAAPLEIELAGGDHTVEAAAAHYKSYRSTITVVPGQAQDLSIPFEKDRPTQPWYMNKVVWGAGGAIVVILLLAL